MIIDLILDRKDGKEYNPKAFYYNVKKYFNVFPEITKPIINAFHDKNEDNIQLELGYYIINEGYDTGLLEYILKNKWL